MPRRTERGKGWTEHQPVKCAGKDAGVGTEWNLHPSSGRETMRCMDERQGCFRNRISLWVTSQFPLILSLPPERAARSLLLRNPVLPIPNPILHFPSSSAFPSRLRTSDRARLRTPIEAVATGAVELLCTLPVGITGSSCSMSRGRRGKRYSPNPNPTNR